MTSTRRRAAWRPEELRAALVHGVPFGETVPVHLVGGRRIGLAAVASCAVVLLAGCGGPIKDDELQRGVQTLGATAAEGRLVALDVIEDRTKTTFVRVEMRDLGDEATHEAEKLSDAEARSGNAAYKRRAVTLAQDVADALGDLQVAPMDRGVARDVEQRLDRLQKRADAIVDAL